MGDMESRSLASALMEGVQAKGPADEKHQMSHALAGPGNICRASASLDRGSPSTHRAIRAAPDGELGPDGASLLQKGRLDLGGEGSSGACSSGSSTSSSLQKGTAA